MAFLTEAECRKAARDGGYGEPTMGAKQATAGYRVHGLHGMKTPGLAGSYWTKAEAMRAAQQAANEEGESITISTPGKAPWITVQPRGANDANGEEFRSVAQRVVNAENDFIEVLMNLGGISHADAAKAMGTMLRLKVAKLDPGIGRINVKNGAYLDRDVIRRAVTGDALPGGFMTTQTETCDRATRLHAALDCVMDRRMAKATDAGPFTVKVGSHYEQAETAAQARERAQALAEAMGYIGFVYRGDQLVESINPRRAQAKDGEMYKLYSAPLRRHLEVRAPMLEGSSEDINDLKSTNSWKTTPSVITNESGKILESNHIGDAATDASDHSFRLHRALDCIMDRRARAADEVRMRLSCEQGTRNVSSPQAAVKFAEAERSTPYNWFDVEQWNEGSQKWEVIESWERPNDTAKFVRTAAHGATSRDEVRVRQYGKAKDGVLPPSMAQMQGGRDLENEIKQMYREGMDVDDIMDEPRVRRNKIPRYKVEALVRYEKQGSATDAPADGLTAEDDGFLRSLLEGATGLARAGIGAMSPTNDRAGRLHRALDCVLDRNLARQ